MKSTLLFVFVLLEVSLCAVDYYWRDFDTREVPDDAFDAASYYRFENELKKKVLLYVGQGHLLEGGGGVIPGDLQKDRFEGPTDIFVYSNGPHGLKHFNKILCSGHKENFRWIPVTSSSTLLAQTANKTMVIGGFENNHLLYIGRTKPEPHWEYIRIGKVINFQTPTNGRLFFDWGKEEGVDSFDILVFDDI